MFSGRTTKRGGGERNSTEPLSQKTLFHPGEKFTKKYEGLGEGGGYPDLSGSTTKITRIVFVSSLNARI